ncbi:MAG: hypothetical protein R3C11_24705 [Planctomycetaceae bacterium]
MKNFDEEPSRGSFHQQDAHTQVGYHARFDRQLDNQILKTSGSLMLIGADGYSGAEQDLEHHRVNWPAWADSRVRRQEPGDDPQTGRSTGGYTRPPTMRLTGSSKLEDGANTVAEYEYDGLGQRI